MIDRHHPLPVTRQCRLVAVARSSVYYTPQPVPAATLALMRQLDELHLSRGRGRSAGITVIVGSPGPTSNRAGLLWNRGGSGTSRPSHGAARATWVM
jgi:putative transposase